jgi:protein-disulfide isomerase-like protein with CxxC motif
LSLCTQSPPPTAAQSREVSHSTWHARNAQTSGDEHSLLIEHPSAMLARTAAVSSASHAASDTTVTTVERIQVARIRRGRRIFEA